MSSTVTTYKGFKIEQVGEDEYHVYTGEEWEYGTGFRTAEWEAGSIQEAQDFIDSY